jgi:RNA polymerase sigma factor (sigma-70 family)
MDVHQMNIEEKNALAFLNHGDHHGFEAIYNRFYHPLLSYGYQFNIIKDQVHDCIQDLFIELWNNRKKLEVHSSLQAYLFRSLRYKIQHQIKKEQVVSRKLTEYCNSSFEITFDEDEYLRICDCELRSFARLKESILQLAPKQKELIYLIFYSKLTYDEAAKIMEISKKTAYNQVHSAIKNLRVSMGNSDSMALLVFLLLLLK